MNTSDTNYYRQKSMKCAFSQCKYKIKYDTGSCSTCEQHYCRRHRLTFEHNCDIQKIKKNHVDKIILQNPVIVGDKMHHRI